MKILIKFALAILLVGVVGFVILQYRMSVAKKASSIISTEFAVTKTTSNLFSRAHDEGFSMMYLENKDTKEAFFNEEGLKNKVELPELQTKLNQMQHAEVSIHIVPFPPFLRWIIRFEIESGIVKSLRKTQLD
jgi:hypothetical protein